MWSRLRFDCGKRSSDRLHRLALRNHACIVGGSKAFAVDGWIRLDRLDRLCCKIGRVRIDGPDSNSAGMGGHVRRILDFGSNDVGGTTDRLEAGCVCAMDFFCSCCFDLAGAFVLWAARRPFAVDGGIRLDRLDRLCCKIGRVRLDGPDSNSAGMDGHVRPILDFWNERCGRIDRSIGGLLCLCDGFLFACVV